VAMGSSLIEVIEGVPSLEVPEPLPHAARKPTAVQSNNNIHFFFFISPPES